MPPLRRLLFRRALKRAIKIGLEQGVINESDKYVLDLALQRPRRWRNGEPIDLIKTAEETAKTQLFEAEGPNAFAEDGGIDWAYWIDLLVTWLPIIIKTILLLMVFMKEDDKD